MNDTSKKVMKMGTKRFDLDQWVMKNIPSMTAVYSYRNHYDGSVHRYKNGTIGVVSFGLLTCFALAVEGGLVSLINSYRDGCARAAVAAEENYVLARCETTRQNDIEAKAAKISALERNLIVVADTDADRVVTPSELRKICDRAGYNGVISSATRIKVYDPLTEEWLNAFEGRTGVHKRQGTCSIDDTIYIPCDTAEAILQQ